jgi:3-methyladenine DNA glycosylase AlkD
MDAVRAVESALQSVADPARAESERAYLKSDLEHLGVRLPAIRKIVAAVPVADRADLLDLVVAFWKPEVHELRMSAIELLIRHVRLLTAADHGVPEALIRDSHTWAYVDALAVKATGALITLHPSTAEILDAYVADPNFWIRRTALLALLPGIRAAEPDLARLSAYGDLLLPETEFFIRKALGWVLRELSKQDPSWVIAWVEPRATAISGVTLREAVRHLPAADADRLTAIYRS